MAEITTSTERVKFIEKYAPKTFEELKLPQRIQTLITAKTEIVGYRLLLYGTGGIGKSTTAKLITKGHDVLYLSGSNDFNVQLLREKVVPFCSSFSITGKQKTLIVDECDNMKDIVQDSFKMILDGSKKVNFIFITNEVEKLIQPFRSRCTNIEYNFQGDELTEQKKNYLNFILHICKSENITYDKPGIQEVFKQNFPDFRHGIDCIQQLVDQNESLTEEHVKFLGETGKENVELYEIITGSTGIVTQQEVYQNLTKFKGRERDCFVSLGEPFFKYLNDRKQYDKILEVAVIVANYSNQFSASLNKFTTFIACCSELKATFR